MIAALRAVGCQSSDLIPATVEPPKDWLGYIGYNLRRLWPWRERIVSNVLLWAGVNNVMKLFGPGDRIMLFVVRFILRVGPVVASLLGFLIWCAAVTGAFVLPWRGWLVPLVTGGPSVIAAQSSWWWEPLVFCFCVAGCTGIFVWLLIRRIIRGLCDIDRIADALDIVLATKIKNQIPEVEQRLRESRAAGKVYRRFVTFEMLDKFPGALPLAVVATNLTETSLEMFSTNRTPRIVVADAVAASMALPVIFRPVSVPGRPDRLYADGGLTSNLPAWTSDVPRKLNPDLIPLGIAITSRTDPKRKAPNQLRYTGLGDLLHSTVFGARELELRRTATVLVPMNPTVGLLDFHMSLRAANAHVKIAHEQFMALMRLRSIRRHNVEHACYQICRGIWEQIAPSKRAEALQVHSGSQDSIQSSSPCIRVALMRPTPKGQRALKIFSRYASTGQEDTFLDERLLYRRNGSLPGLAWDRGTPQLRSFEESGRFDAHRVVWDHREPGSRVSPRLRFAHQHLWQHAKWGLAVPFNAPGALEDGLVDLQYSGANPSSWVFYVDSSIPLHLFDFCSPDFSADQHLPHVVALMKVFKSAAASLSYVNDVAHTVMVHPRPNTT